MCGSQPCALHGMLVLNMIDIVAQLEEGAEFEKKEMALQGLVSTLLQLLFEVNGQYSSNPLWRERSWPRKFR